MEWEEMRWVEGRMIMGEERSEQVGDMTFHVTSYRFVLFHIISEL